MRKKIVCLIEKAGRGILLQMKRHSMLHSKEFQLFKSECENSKVILINTPEHRNLGDQAIAIAQQRFLKKECGICHFYEFTRDEYESCKLEIGRYTNKEDIFFLHGGGSIGTLWPKEEDIILQILEQFYENRIFIFPQTVYFEQSDYGKSEEKKLYAAIKRCTNLNIFVREKYSYDYLCNKIEMNQQHCFCVPDIVTYLKVQHKNIRKSEVLICLRKDKERVLSKKFLAKVTGKLNKEHFKIVYTDTVSKCRVSKRKRVRTVYKKLSEFSKARLVITDRLHGMLFAAITGTPCIALDNISKKVSGVYQWIQYLKYIRFVQAKDVNDELIDEMLQIYDAEFSNEELKKYFEVMKEIIQTI